MRSLSRWLIVLVLLAACTAPTPIALAPSPEPSSTPVPPTSMPTVAPTATPQPPTVTPTSTSTATPSPTLTATSIPTQAATATKAPTKAATKATATQAPAPATSVPRSGAVPSGAPLNVAVRVTFDNAQRLLGELNNVLAGIGGSCETAISKYDAIASAPTYDVAGQSDDVQAAYGLYRQAIDTVNATASKVRRVCNAGGGPISRLDIQEAQRSMGQAVPLLGSAIDRLPPVTVTIAAPNATPKPTAQISSIALSDLLLQTMDRMHIAGGILDGAQTNLDAGFCDQFKPLYQTIIAVVGLNEAGRDPTWIDSYGAYKVAVAYFQNKLYRAMEVCNAGGGAIGKAEFSDMRRAVDAAAIAIARAYDELKAKNLLGQ